MINKFFIPICLLLIPALVRAEDASPRSANTIVLDDTAVKNLRLEIVPAEETTFEETLFALGRVEAIPANRAVVSSRIPGRVLELKATLGDTIEAGADVAKIESRQPGDPPPSIVLRAPISGLVTESQARLGEPVDPEKALLEITNLNEVYAAAQVPEHQAGRLKPGTLAHIRIAALPEEKHQGTLLRFGTQADRESGTVDAIFRLSNSDGLIRPGMRAEFSIVVGKREDVMSIPRGALQGDPAGRFVYVTDFDLKNAFIKTPVEIGAQNDRFVEIVKGLLPGDEVVTRGSYSLAFAGKGSISLKEALDAAHGHEHAADGSEMTAEQRAKAAAEKAAAAGSESTVASGPLIIILAGVSILLLVLLILSVATRAKR